ncbi:MAG: urea ABC transporter permease subunit UrtB [Alphaproteobacteria bacterium]|nr:urea ABC transporter permease subunit UrtB [Alphaproteobacteria bacterium]
MLAASLVAILLLASSLARADDFTDALKPLANDSYADTVAVIERLAELGDPRAVPLLRALGDGELRVRKPDGGAFIVRAGKASDVATGAAADAAGAEPVRVNNRVRVAVRGALGRLSLYSPDASERLEAARAVLKSRSADNVPLLEKAIEAEKDPAIRAVKTLALAASRLMAPARDVQLAGVAGLAATSDPEMLAILRGFAGDAAAHPDAKSAAERAIVDAEARVARLRLIQTAFQGLSLGSVLLLAALGLAITFGVMGVINMAHGEMVMLGAYATFVVQQAIKAYAPGLLEMSLLLALPAAFLTAGAVGVALERGLIRHLYGRPLETLLMTWGLSMILQQAVRSLFGATNREVTPPSWMTGSLDIFAGVAITTNRLWIIGFGLAVLALMWVVIRFTWFGLQMRAVTQNRAMARAMGVRSGWIDALTFGLGCGIAGLAGVALSQIDNVSPNLGQGYIVDSFMVVVFGGVGNLLGTLIGAMSLGVVNKLLEPYAGAVLGKILVLIAIILFIQIRPRGLFALKGRAVEA